MRKADSSVQQLPGFHASGVCKRAAQVQYHALLAHRAAQELMEEMTGGITVVMMEMTIPTSSTAVMELFPAMKNVMTEMSEEETDVPRSAELKYPLISAQEQNAVKEEMMSVDHLD